MLLMPLPLHPFNVHGIKPMCMEGCWLQNQNEFGSELECLHFHLKIGWQSASFSEVCLGFSFSWIFNTERQRSALFCKAQLVHGTAWEKLLCEVGCLTLWRYHFHMKTQCLCPLVVALYIFPVFLFSCCTCSFKVHTCIYENNKTSKAWLLWCLFSFSAGQLHCLMSKCLLIIYHVNCIAGRWCIWTQHFAKL